MADVRTQPAIKIIDPTDNTLQAAVLALSADNVVATTEGLVVAAFPHWFDGATWDRALGDATDGLLVNLGANNDVTTELAAVTVANAALQITGDEAHDDPDSGNPLMIGGHANAAAPVDVGENDRVRAWFELNGSQAGFITDGSGNIAGVSASGLKVDLGSDNDVTLASITSNVVPGTGAADLGKAESAAHTTGDTGVFALSVRQDATASLAADLQYAPLQTDASGRLKVADPNAGAGSPSTPAVDYATLASLAAGTESTTEFRTADLASDTFRLAGVDFGASVPTRCEVSVVDDDVVTIIATLFAPAGLSYSWRLPHKDYGAKTWDAGAGFDGFQLLITNLDASEAADVYGTMYYED